MSELVKISTAEFVDDIPTGTINVLSELHPPNRKSAVVILYTCVCERENFRIIPTNIWELGRKDKSDKSNTSG